MTIQHQVRAQAKNVIPAISGGAHICQIFCDDDERNDSLLNFLLHALKKGQCATCFSDSVNERELSAFINKNNLSYGELLRSGAFTLADSSEIYLQDNVYDPDRMIDWLRQYYLESKTLGFPGMWVFREITREVKTACGGNRLLEYEQRLDLLLDQCPMISVCQYDIQCFDGQTIMDILKIHPLMLVRGEIVRNPFFIAAAIPPTPTNHIDILQW